jgi:hypothetical protein
MRQRLKEVLDRPAYGREAEGKIQRCIIPVIYVLAMLVLVAALMAFGWEPVWSFIGVPTMTPHFADMRTVQGGLESLAQGFDPQIENPGDPWGRRMNYPSVWLELAAFLRLYQEANFTASVTVFLALAALTILYLNTRFPSVWILLLSLSTAILLGFERGNNDLVVFILVTLACLSPRGLAMGLVIVSAMLKVFPLVAGAMFLDNLRRFAVFSVTATVSAAILLPELAQIRAGVPQSALLSYGSGSFGAAAAHVGLYIPNLLISAILVGLAVIFYLIMDWPETPRQAPQFSLEQRLFLAGGAIFLGTFLLSSNFDYRLIFLILCIPYLASCRGLLRHISLTCALASANFLVMANLGTLGIAMNLVCKGALFVCISHYFLKIIVPVILGWMGTDDP